MSDLIKRLWLITGLILTTSVILLISDRKQRVAYSGRKVQSIPSIAIMQISSTTLLDMHVAGILDRLKEKGYWSADGRNIHRFNPQGDYATANAIAREIVNSPYDILITSSTLALQVVSKANLSVQKTHVFGAVTDPFGAGVGITGSEPDQHPPYLAGVGTFQPVGSAIRIAHDLNPDLKRLGVVWNPGEQCSEACLKEDRKICRELGIELVEAIATNTSEISEATRSLTVKNVDAIWIGGDTVAMASIGLIIHLANQAGIPVFTNDPLDADKGALFGLGADYYTVGQYTADIAIAILEGRKATTFRIENMIPERLGFNPAVMANLKSNWKMTSAVQKKLAEQKTASQEKPLTSEPFELRLVLYSDTEFAERCREGLIDGIRQAGLVEGRDYHLTSYNAQGDMSTLSSIMTTIKSDRVDLLMVVSTPTLQAALRQLGDRTKIVFTGVGDGVRAGAGKSEVEHLPNVTGITTRSPFDGMARIICETLPTAQRVGTLFTPGEINSVLYKDWFKEALEKRGLQLVAIPVTSSADITQAAIELCGKKIDVVGQIVDNLTRPGFALIARKAMENNLPVYVFDSDQMKHGGVICLARDYYDAGLEAAEKAIRILQGEHPGNIPFDNTQSEKLILNLQLAGRYNLHLSDEIKNKATVYTINE